MADSSKKRLAGKVTIVTGSGRGIGRCEALLMAQQGAKVVVSDIGTDAEGGNTAVNVADEIRAAGGEAVATTDSVVTMEGARRTVDAAVQSFGGLDILINNAGLTGCNPIDKMTEEEWDRVVDSHLKSYFVMIKFAVPVFKRQGGGGRMALHRRRGKRQRAILFRCGRGDRTLVGAGAHPQSRAARRLGSRFARFLCARGDDRRPDESIPDRGSIEGRRVV